MKLLIFGAHGQVGCEIVRIFKDTPYEVVGITRKELDCTRIDLIFPVLTAICPDIIINAAAYTAVDKAEDESDLAFVINKHFVHELAIVCSQIKIPLIHLSTDYVFDGAQIHPYCELDIPNPQSVYAKSKFEGEKAIIAELQQHIILRISWVFGVYGSNFVKTIVNLASSREQLKIVGDQWGRPTAARDIARVIFEIVNKIRYGNSFSNWGIYHYAGDGQTNWYEFARIFLDIARANGLNLALTSLVKISSEEYKTKVRRPKNSVLSTLKIEQNLGIISHHWKYYLPEVIDAIREEKNNELSN